MKSIIKSKTLDQLGMTASVACALHCAALPFAAIALPLLGLEFLANIWIEVIMILFSLIIGTWSMLSSHREHRNYIPVMVLLAGFMLIWSGHFLWCHLEAVLIPVGGFTVAGAHYINLKLIRSRP
jgi:hypothetical protein